MRCVSFAQSLSLFCFFFLFYFCFSFFCFCVFRCCCLSFFLLLLQSLLPLLLLVLLLTRAATVGGSGVRGTDGAVSMGMLLLLHALQPTLLRKRTRNTKRTPGSS